nr:VWA domain-containing protein [Phormidium sp. FACHB-592]
MPLLELFTRLREAGLPLGIADYEAAVKSLQKGYGLPDRAALARLCQTLWVRSFNEQQLFDYYFNQSIERELAQPESLATKTDQPDQGGRQSQTFVKDILSREKIKDSLVLLVGGGAFTTVLLVVTTWTPPKSKVTTPIVLSPSTSPVPSTSNVPVQPTQTAQPIQPWSPSNQIFGPPPAGLLLILLVSAGLIGLGTVWLLRGYQIVERFQRHSPPSTSSSKPNSTPPSKLLHTIKDEVQVAQAMRQVTSQKQGKSGDCFLLTTDYLPVTQRQMKQSWRHLRRMVREGMATELDVEATVHRIAHDGMLLNPVLVARRTNRTELVLLIDQDGSMVPFHSLSARLVETALRGGRLGKAGAYYFHNCPVDYLYNDPTHQEAKPIEEVLREFQRDRTAVLIFSDAGAARGGLNLERADLTATFLQQLKQQVRYVAWLNPMPKARWNTSTAREIALQVPMFEATRQGLDEAIDALRGRHHLLAALLGGQK